MRLKLDENLPESLAAELTAFRHDVDTVRKEGLTGYSDQDVWAATQSAGRFLVTQDLDFSDVRVFRPGTLPSTFYLLPSTFYLLPSLICRR